MKQEKVWYKDPKNCSLIGQQQVKSLWNLLRLEGYKDCTGNHRENRYHGTYFQIKPNRKSGRGGVWSGTRRRTRGRGTSSNISVGITNRTPNSTGWQSASPYRSRSTRIINIYIYIWYECKDTHTVLGAVAVRALPVEAAAADVTEGVDMEVELEVEVVMAAPMVKGGDWASISVTLLMGTRRMVYCWLQTSSAHLNLDLQIQCWLTLTARLEFG